MNFAPLLTNLPSYIGSEKDVPSSC